MKEGIKIFRITILYILVFSLILLPLWMWFSWFFTPSKKLEVLILDKTVLTKEAREHRSFNWILTNSNFVRTDNSFYKISEDYYGFFPQNNFKYEINGLENCSGNDLQKLSEEYNMVYYTDTYGIYSNEWYLKKNINERSSLVYGGMNESDMLFLKMMRASGKLILMEFNTFAQPTPVHIRKEVEKNFNVKWTGWTGRYFPNLDTLNNEEIPKWLIKLYKEQHNDKWLFKSSGIAFVHENETVEILDNMLDLKSEYPQIISSKFCVAGYDVPQKLPYDYWFDILEFNRDSLNILSNYNIETTIRGDSILSAHNIPKKFPAVVTSKERNKFFYFAGDFADNSIPEFLQSFNGIELFKDLLYSNETSLREAFFWNFYRPFVKSILEEYYCEIEEEN